MSTFAQATEYTTESQNSAGAAMQRFGAYEDSIEAKTNRLAASFQELSNNTLDSGLIKAFFDFANVLVNATDKVGVFNVAFLTTIGALGGKGIIKIPQLATFIGKLIQPMLGASVAAGTLAGTMGAALSVILPAAAIIGAIALYNTLNITLEEHKQLLEKSKQTYEESSSELESVNQRLSEVKTRMSELTAMDNLTFAEKGELDKLKQTNEQLLIQKDILEKLNAENQKDVILNTIDTYKKQFGSNKATQQQVSEYADNASTTGNNALLMSDENDIPAMIAAYKQFTNLKNEAYGDSEEVQRYTVLLSDISTSLFKNVDDLNNYKTTLESVPFEQLSDDQKDYLNNINSSIALIYENLDPNKWKQIKFEKYFNAADFEDTKNKLIELSKAGKLDESVIANGEEYQSLLYDTGLTAAEIAEQINALNTVINTSSASLDNSENSLYALAEAAKEATGYVNNLGENVDIRNLQDAITNAKTIVDDFNTILKSVKDNNGLTSDNLDTITQKYPKLLAYINDEDKLREELQKSIKDQETTAENYYTSVLEMDTGFYQGILKNNADKVKKLAEYYGTDIANWQSLAQAKADIDGILLTKLTEKWADYYRLRNQSVNLESITNSDNSPVKNLLGEDFYNLTMPDINKSFKEGLEKQTQNALNTAEEAQKNYDDLKNIFVDTDYTSSLISNIDLTNDKPSSSTKDSFSQIFDWISIRIDKLKEKAQKAIDDVKNYINYTDKNKQLDIVITAKIDEQNNLKFLQDSYLKLADNVGLPKKYRELVDNGGLNIQTVTDKSLADKIEEYQKWKNAAAGVTKEISLINEEIKELYSQKLDNITEYFGTKNDYINTKISRRESLISLYEASGKAIKTSDYEYLIKLQNDIIANTKKELDSYSSTFYQQVNDGTIITGSHKYYEGLSKINELNKAIRDGRSTIYDYKTEIRELNWKSFDEGITKINGVKSELSDLVDLISDSEILDDGGNYTQEGLTKLGLLTQQMSENSKLISEYENAIKRISKELKAGDISQEIYNEELSNYQNLQRTAVKDNQALEDSIAEIAKQRLQFEIDAINKETDAFKKLVDAKKEALSAEKELHDYQESINNKQQSIDTLQKQIAVLKLSTDRKDISQRLKLEKELKEQQSALDEEQYQHSIDIQSEALDKEYNDFKESQDAKISTIEESLNNQKELVKSTLDEVFKNTVEIGAGIQTLVSEHGISVTESVIAPWQNASSALAMYKTALEDLPKADTIIDTGLNIGTPSSSSGSGSNSTNSSSSNSSSNSSTSSSSKETSTATSKTSTASSKPSLPINTVKYTGTKSALNKETSVVDRLKYFDLDSSLSARATLYKYFGLKGSYMGTSAQNIQLIAAMKKAGFSKGGTGKLVNSIEDEGFALMKRDETTLSSEQTEQLKSLLGYAPLIKTSIDSIRSSDYPNIQNNNPVNVHYDNLITVQGDVDNSNIRQLELIAQQAVERGNRNLITLLNQRR